MMKAVKKIKPFKFVPPSKKQLKVQTWWIADKIKEHDGIIADGAIRSGKTMSTLYLAVRMKHRRT